MPTLSDFAGGLGLLTDVFAVLIAGIVALVLNLLLPAEEEAPHRHAADQDDVVEDVEQEHVIADAEVDRKRDL